MNSLGSRDLVKGILHLLPYVSLPYSSSPFSSLACLCQCVCAKSLHLCLAVCDPMDCSPPGSSVHGILQARILEWVTMPFSRGSSQPKDRTHVFCSSCIAGRFFTAEPPGKPWCQKTLILSGFPLSPRSL